MTQSNQQVDAITDRLQLPFLYDVAKMQAEVEALNFSDFIYYDAIPLTGPAHFIDPSLSAPPPVDDFADGSWTNWLETPVLKKCPYITSIVEYFRLHTKVTLVRLLRLAPDSVVREHADPTLGLHITKSVIRLTVPIVTNEAVTFFLNGTPVPMRMGECWYLRLTDPHSITNKSDTERINLTIDVIPNEWLRSIITNEV